MSQTITVEIIDGRLTVRSPYEPTLPVAARNLGGQWDGDGMTCDFDPRDEATVRALCLSTYGDDGLPYTAAQATAGEAVHAASPLKSSAATTRHTQTLRSTSFALRAWTRGPTFGPRYSSHASF